ncbi:endonuclease/exonuclease/phosphatase family protein [Parvularcula lutaonensis]|uniref:Endonuclease/exonuclease/phosphatase family protein n=1 Tax=Parvularcula lutaonensis TaxID=491923 RepID=A0ABV7M9A0_9PROT
MFANILYRQVVLDRTAEWALAEGADVLVIAEMPRGPMPVMPPGWTPMPQRCLPSHIFVFVREGTVNCRAIGDSRRPGLLFDAPANLQVIGLHTTVPFKVNGLARRKRELAGVAHTAPEGPLLLIGDFNIVPWSDDFELMSSRGFTRLPIGAQSTWLSSSPALGLPIDHALVRGDLEASARPGPWMGSDHRPLFVQISLLD